MKEQQNAGEKKLGIHLISIELTAFLKRFDFFLKQHFVVNVYKHN